MSKTIDETIEIFCRVRPVKNELSTYKISHSFEGSTIEFFRPRQILSGIVNNSRERYDFKFNGIFDMEVNQEEVYDRCARKCVSR